MYADLGHYHCRHRSYGRISSYYALYLPAIAFSRCVYYSMRFVAISGYFGVVAEFCILPLPFLLQRSKTRFAKQNGIFILYKQNVDKIYFKWYKSYTLCFFEKV